MALKLATITELERRKIEEIEDKFRTLREQKKIEKEKKIAKIEEEYLIEIGMMTETKEDQLKRTREFYEKQRSSMASATGSSMKPMKNAQHRINDNNFLSINTDENTTTNIHNAHTKNQIQKPVAPRTIDKEGTVSTENEDNTQQTDPALNKPDFNLMTAEQLKVRKVFVLI